MNIQRIKNTPISFIMSHYGFPVAKHSGDSLFYIAPWRDEHTASVSVSIRKNLFFDHGDSSKKGSVIDMVRFIENCSLSEAIEKLKGILGKSEEKFIEPPKTQTIEIDLESKPNWLINREIDLTDWNLIHYVTQERGIPLDIAQKFLRELEIEHRIFHKKQTVLGMKNNAEGWEIRGKNGDFKSCIGHKDFTFFDEGSDKVLVTEGMFDLLAAVTLGKQICSEKTNYLVLHSLSNINMSMTKMLEYTQIFLALDLDFPGKIKTETLIESDPKFVDISGKYQMKDGKDVNDFLRYYQTQNRNRGQSL